LRIEARRAALTADAVEPLTEPEIRIEFTEAKISDETFAGRSTQHKAYSINRARWPQPVLAPMVHSKSVDLIDQVRADPALKNVKRVQSARIKLERGISALHRDIEAQLHKRASAATSSLLALLLGAVLSMRLKDKMPLEVYFWTFLLAMLVTIITYSGANVATNPSLPAGVGLFVTWSGAALLAAVVVLLYVKLCKN
jgi:lipopolysaccharide export LptBFGC system permease protein LptF